MWSAFGGSSSFGVDNNVGSTTGEDQTIAVPASDLEKNESDVHIKVSDSKDKKSLGEGIEKDGKVAEGVPLEESHSVDSSRTPDGVDPEVIAKQDPDDDDANSDPLDKLLKSLSEKTPPVPCFSPPTPTSPMRALGLGTFFAPEQQRQVLSSPTAYNKYANI
jgi:hypothetical protein